MSLPFDPTMTRPRLPNELLEHIVKRSSQGTLVVLARVNKDLQDPSERHLYSSLCITEREGQSPALRSMLSQLRRTSYLKRLSVEFNEEPSEEDEPFQAAILQLLNGACSLRDLRINLMAREELASFASAVEELLCSGVMSLRILLCDSSLDFSKIVAKQHSLRFLGVFRWLVDDVARTSALVPQLAQDNRSLIVALHERDTYLPVFNIVHLFPDTLSSVSETELEEILACAFSLDQTTQQIRLQAQWATEIRLYMSISTPQNVLWPSCSTISSVLAHGENIILYYRSLPDMIHEEVLKALASFPELTTVALDYWPGCGSGLVFNSSAASSLSKSELSSWVTQLAEKCPTLSQVRASCGLRATRETGWVTEK